MKKSIIIKVVAILLRIMLGIGFISLPFIPRLYNLISDYVFNNQIVIIKVIFIPTILSMAVAVVAFVVSLCFYVLSQVFKMAIEYKNEIDYTV